MLVLCRLRQPLFGSVNYKGISLSHYDGSINLLVGLPIFGCFWVACHSLYLFFFSRSVMIHKLIHLLLVAYPTLVPP